MFSGIKDSLASTAAKSMLASRIDRYARLTELTIRSREKTIHATVVLEGEEESISIAIENYRILAKNGENVLIVESVTATKVWLQNLLQDLLKGKELVVPPLALFALGKPEA